MFREIEGCKEFFEAEFLDAKGLPQLVECPSITCPRQFQSMPFLIKHVTHKHAVEKPKTWQDTTENKNKKEEAPVLTKKERRRRKHFMEETHKLDKECLSKLIYYTSIISPNSLTQIGFICF